jgi:peptide deformylase
MRRSFSQPDPRLAGLLLVLALLAPCACASAPNTWRAWSADELATLQADGKAMHIVSYDIHQPDPASVLRQRAAPVVPGDPELRLLLERMAATLEHAGGVGLAAPQVGISRRVILVKHGTRPTGQPTRVVAYLNPVIEWSSPETDDDYEACLSIDGVGGLVRRARRLRVSSDPVGSGARVVVDYADWDARILQHEIDHLDGVLFVDKLAGPLLPSEEMRRLRDEGHRQRGWIPPSAEPER